MYCSTSPLPAPVLLKVLQEHAVTRQIPILVTSTNPEYLQIAIENEAQYGADRNIAKPMDLEVLLQQVYELAGRP